MSAFVAGILAGPALAAPTAPRSLLAGRLQATFRPEGVQPDSGEADDVAVAVT
jgi:hypothetical protein